MAIAVRNASAQDIPAILEIYNQAVLHRTCTADIEPQSLEARTDWFQQRIQNGCPVLVAQNGDLVVGWSSYGPYHTRPGYRFTVENSVYVHQDHQGRSIGRQLLQPLVQYAKANGVHSIMAVIDAENIPSMKLHASEGFVEAGRYRELVYKFDRWLDVVVMQILL